MADVTRPPESPHEEAFRQVLAHRTMLKAYVLAIVRDPELAEDTLSDVAVELARNWSQYDASRPFAPWARGVARRVALANLRKRQALPSLLDAAVLDAVGADLDALGDEARLEARKNALRRCLERLPEGSRRLVRLRYFENQSYEAVSRAVQRNVNALYVALNRIHEALTSCVQKHLGSA